MSVSARSQIRQIRQIGDRGSEIEALYRISSFSHVVSELVKNSVESGAQVVRISVSLGSSLSPASAPQETKNRQYGEISCSVWDDGKGIAPAVLQQLGEAPISLKTSSANSSHAYGATLKAVAMVSRRLSISTVQDGFENRKRVVRTSHLIPPAIQLIGPTKRVYRTSGTVVEIDGVFSLFPLRRGLLEHEIESGRENEKIIITAKAVALLHPALAVFLTIGRKEKGANVSFEYVPCRDRVQRFCQFISACRDDVSFAIMQNHGMIVEGYFERPDRSGAGPHNEIICIEDTPVTRTGPSESLCVLQVCAKALHVFTGRTDLSFVLFIKPIDAFSVSIDPGGISASILHARSFQQMLQSLLMQSFGKNTDGPAEAPVETKQQAMTGQDPSCESPIRSIIDETTCEIVLSRNVGSRRVAHSRQPSKSVAELLASWTNPCLPPTAVQDRTERINIHQLKEVESTHHAFRSTDLKSARVVGYLGNRFILVIMDQVLVAIDQHAAHERIRLEEMQGQLAHSIGFQETIVESKLKFRTARTRGDVRGDLCVVDSIMTAPMSAIDLDRLARFSNTLARWGWRWDSAEHEVDRTGFKSVRFTTAPQVAGVTLSHMHLLGFLRQLHEAPSRDHSRTTCEYQDIMSVFLSAPEAVRMILASKACHTAIRFGDQLSGQERQALVHALTLCSSPFQCAHGRPSLAVITNFAKTSPSQQ